MSRLRRWFLAATGLLLLLSNSAPPRGSGPAPLRTVRSRAPAVRARVHLMTLFGLTSPEPSQLPLYMNYYAESCGYNAAYTDCTIFLLVSDAHYAEYARWPVPRFFACRPHDDALPANVRLRLLNDSEWIARTMAQTGLSVVYGTERVHKLADYKPLLAHIFGPFSPALGSAAPPSSVYSWTERAWRARFEDYLPEGVYTHWGFADPDVIFGDLSRFFLPTHDLWLSYFRGGWQEQTAAGQLVILRNAHAYRELWRDADTIYETGQWPEGELMKTKRVTYSELLFGLQLFSFANQHNSSFYHKLVSFSDERGNRVGNIPGRFFDLWWEDGHVYATRACNARSIRPYPVNQAVTYHVEGAIMHTWAMKKFLADPKQNNNQTQQSMFSCAGWDFPNASPWHDRRWNYSFVTRGGVQFVKASFHDPNWRAESDFPTGSCPQEDARARPWGT
jgi:hypothetical protein